MQMFLKITPEFESNECYTCGSECLKDLKCEEVGKDTIVNGLSEMELKNFGLIRVKDGLSQNTINTLKEYGWVHAKSAKDRAEKMAFEQKFYIIDELGNQLLYARPVFAEIDLDNLDDNRIDALASGAKIVQFVSIKSVLSEKDYGRYLKKKKAKEEAAAKKKSAKKAAAEAKKKKEIEKAKKLLLEAGELNAE